MNRKDFLRFLGGATAGVPLGAFGAYGYYRVRGPKRWSHSFSQSGEDLVVNVIFDYLRIQKVDYLDIGAFDPTQGNNTYYFYLRGNRGVLVEPNGEMCSRLRSVRPEDVTLEAGIGVDGAKQADYYVMSNPSWNTFSKEEADRVIATGQGSVREVRKIPMLDVNQVMANYFSGAPAYLSIDTEGFDLPILQAIDYRRLRPKVICAETMMICGASRVTPKIGEFMRSQGYVARGGSFVNTIFVDSQVFG